MKKTYLLLLFLFCVLNVFAQTNQEKYWFYRNRLKRFVSVGNQSGESCIACIRNKFNGGKLRYGQHLTHMGYYIGILATEFKLLYNSGQFEDANNTLIELEYALMACERLDKCENTIPWYLPNSDYDGFLVREDVPRNFVSSHPDLNYKLTPANNVDYFKNINQKGMPAYVDTIDASINVFYDWEPGELTFAEERAISIDEVIPLLKGLALVKRCCHQSSWHYNKAIELASKILKYLRNYEHFNGPLHWWIYRPDGVKVIEDNGGYAGIFKYGFAKAYEYFTGIPPEIFLWQEYTISLTYFAWKDTWNALQLVPTSPGNNHMVAELAAIGNSFNISFVNTTRIGINTITEQENWDTFYLLLWKVLQNGSNSSFINKALDQLNGAPLCGPYCYEEGDINYPQIGDYAPNGWASTAKFWHVHEKQKFGDDDNTGNYDGTDFMLLYNLYHLVENPEPYVRLLSREINDYYFPCLLTGSIIGVENNSLEIRGYLTIESNSMIDTKVHLTPFSPITFADANGDVRFYAGEKIVLKPGFQVKAGAHFIAKIEDFSCSNLNKSLSEGLYSDGPTLNALDSMYWFPYAPVFLNKNEKDYYIDMYMQTDTSLTENLTDTRINIYPNPNRGQFTAFITNYNNENISLSVSNMLGKTILNKINIKQNEISVNISNHPTGIYYVQVVVGNKIFKEKIIVQ